MIYFPPNNDDPFFSAYENLGTNFYKSKKTNSQSLDIWKSKYLDQNTSKNFLKIMNFFIIQSLKKINLLVLSNQINHGMM